jgi:hypothetical protein
LNINTACAAAAAAAAAAGNAFMAELQSRIVPLLVEKEDFWARYFYRCNLCLGLSGCFVQVQISCHH